MKKCPYCAEEIQEEAIFCRYCKKEIHSAVDLVNIIKEKRIFLWSFPIIVLCLAGICYYLIKTAYLDPQIPFTFQTFLLAIRFVAFAAEGTFLGFVLRFSKNIKIPWFVTIVYCLLVLFGLGIVSYFGLWINADNKINQLKKEISKREVKEKSNDDKREQTIQPEAAIIIPTGKELNKKQDESMGMRLLTGFGFISILILIIVAPIIASSKIKVTNTNTDSNWASDQGNFWATQTAQSQRYSAGSYWVTQTAIAISNPVRNHTQVMTFPSTATKSLDCYPWPQITSSMVGRTICVYGVVTSIYNTTVSTTRIKFTSLVNSFFLDDVEYYFPDLRVGDCAYAVDIVKQYNNILYMTISHLYHCESWMR